MDTGAASNSGARMGVFSRSLSLSLYLSFSLTQRSDWIGKGRKLLIETKVSLFFELAESN